MSYYKHKLLTIKKKQSGRDASGHVSVRHQGGQHKRFLRNIDWKRNKLDIPAKVAGIEYDPNRTAAVALIIYADGQKSYILAPYKLKVGDTIITSPQAEIKLGNCLYLKNIRVYPCSSVDNCFLFFSNTFNRQFAFSILDSYLQNRRNNQINRQ